jgi:thymidylate synthase ThyX
VPEFTSDEQRALAPYFSNLDGPVFALTNLPETVKGALFARYSRSAKSLRRLFLDEFLKDVEHAQVGESKVGLERAERLYAKVFADYGDDSVAQLGGVHLACEGVSNVLTKILEWGRLMAYLEQSTRYVPYTDRPGGRWKYHVPTELAGTPLADRYHATLDRAFETYARWFEPMQAHFRARFPKEASDSDAVYRAAIRAKALDTLRGLLPAAVQSNLGLFGTGQAYEALLLRMRANPLAECREYADLILTELRKVIPGIPDTRRSTRARRPLDGLSRRDAVPRSRASGPTFCRMSTASSVPKWPSPISIPTEKSRSSPRRCTPCRISRTTSCSTWRGACRPTTAHACSRRTSGAGRIAGTSRGARSSARAYRFDILADYGAFRDLQRHRLLTLEWQPLGALHGYVEPDAIEAAGAHDEWTEVMNASAELHDSLHAAGLSAVAPVRGVDGLPHPVLHGDERARGDAPHRAADGAAGTSRVPAHLPGDAHAHRRQGGPSPHRRRHDIRGSLRGGTGTA